MSYKVKINVMKIVKHIVFGLLTVGIFSCVPVNQLTDAKKRAESLQNNNQLLKEKNRELEVENNELDGRFVQLQRRYEELKREVNVLTDERDKLRYENKRLKQNEEELEEQISVLQKGSTDEIAKLLSELQEMQQDLQDREDRVYQAEKALKEREEELARAQNELKAQQQQLTRAEDELAQQQARLMVLEDALNNQKRAVTELKEKLNSALRGFYDQGLSVNERNGKVYVSLEENLLFKTGSYSVDPAGQAALESLSEVLAANPDINIMVEGHTDNVPLNGSGQIKDNWDLSVMRATAVTKIILKNVDIDPSRITAAGRSKYVPLDEADTPQARRKNRRTEIILTPDLSEVFDIIQTN